MNLRGRSFLTLLDYSPEEIRFLLDLSHACKREKREKRERGCRRSISISVQAGKRVLGCGRICRRLSRKWSAVIGQGRKNEIPHRIKSMQDRAFSIFFGTRVLLI